MKAIILPRMAPIEEAREIKESLPHAKFVTVENAGHMPFLENGFKIQVTNV